MEQPLVSAITKKVTFYVDGFNFYYGLRDVSDLDQDWKKFYWINICELCKSFLGKDEELIATHYFTARPKNISKMTRQNKLMEVNKKLNKELFKVHYGKYQEKTVKCLATCKESFITYEEKETDVNIAVKLIEDCVLGSSDKIVLISADSDLIPPIRFIYNYCHEHGKSKEVLILFPPQHYSSALANFKYIALQMGKYKNRFKKSLLPKKLVFKDGKQYEIPQNWNINYDDKISDEILNKNYTSFK